MKIVQSIAIVSMLAFAGAAYAQQPAAAPSAPAAKAKPERSAKSLECSKQADAQSLHGKPRKHFMRKCKKS